MTNPLDITLPSRPENGETWHWATVTSLAPLRIRLDGDSSALLSTPEDLVGGLAVNERVWVQRYGTRLTIFGKVSGVLAGNPNLNLSGTVITMTTGNTSTAGLEVIGHSIRQNNPALGTGVVVILTTSSGDPAVWFSLDGTTGGNNPRILGNSTTGLTMYGGSGKPVVIIPGTQLDVRSPILYSGIPSTTSGSANIVAASSPANVLYKTTSSRRNKIDIEDVSTPPERLLEVAAREWWDRNEYEAAGGDTSGLERIPGLIAEELLEAGLEQFVTYEEDPDDPSQMRVGGVMYDRVWTLLVPLVKAQRDRIAELEEQASKFEERLAALEQPQP